MKKNLFILSGLLLCCTTFLSAQQHEPDIDWRTLETEHFSIHFPATHKQTALLVAGLCEAVYDSVSALLNYWPARTEVVLHTRTPVSNGFVAPMPWRMELMITEPQENWMGSRDSWLRLLITHEFTHVAHLRKRRGLSSLTKPFLGDLNAFWQALTPNWFIEGYPTYTETILNRGGRGRNPFHRMAMEAPVFADKPWKLENTSYLSRKTNPAFKLYISGYFMSEFIAEKYGDSTWTRIIDRYSAWPVFGFNRAVKKTTGKSLNTLYNEMVEQIKNTGRSLPAKKEVPTSYYSPRWRDENSLIVLKTGFDILPAFVRIDADGSEHHLLDRIPGQRENGLSLSRDWLVWSESIPHQRFSATEYFELRAYDPAEGTLFALSEKTRLQSPDITRNGRRIVAIEYDAPVSRIVELRPGSGERRVLLQSSSAVFLNPRWSPQENSIAFARKDSTGRQDIALLDPHTGNWRYLHEPDAAHDNNPEWSPDGRTIFYSSDRSGRFDIWAAEVATGRRWKVTDEPLGAFSPAVSPSGTKLAYSKYTYSGFQLAVMELDSSHWTPASQIAPQFAGPALRVQTTDARRQAMDVVLRESSYRPSKQLLKPQAWLPVYVDDMEAGAAGLWASAEDALHRHNWSGFAALSLEQERLPVFDVQYSYRRFWPVLSIREYGHAAQVQARINGENKTLWWRRSGRQLSVTLPLLLERNVSTRTLRSSISLLVEDISAIRGPYRPLLTRYAGLTADLSYSRFSATLRDIMPHSSLFNYLLFESDINAFGNAYSSQRLLAYNQLVLPTPLRHHKLELLAVYQNLRGNYPFQLSFSAVPAGYDNNISSRQRLRLKAGYHLPLFYLEYGLPLLPVFLDYLAGEVFYDLATHWQNGIGNTEWADNALSSFGLRLRLRSYVFQALPVEVSVVWAYRSADGTSAFFPELSVPLPFLNRSARSSKAHLPRGFSIFGR